MQLGFVSIYNVGSIEDSVKRMKRWAAEWETVLADSKTNSQDSTGRTNYATENCEDA